MLEVKVSAVCYLVVCVQGHFDCCILGIPKFRA